MKHDPYIMLDRIIEIRLPGNYLINQLASSLAIAVSFCKPLKQQNKATADQQLIMASSIKQLDER
jgi:hypothetical protein